MVGASPSGAWAGHAGELACWSTGAWIFAAPRDGMRLMNRATGQMLLYRGSWRVAAKPAAPTGGATVDTQARAAISALVTALAEAGIFAQT